MCQTIEISDVFNDNGGQSIEDFVGATYDKSTALGVAEYLLDCSGQAMRDGDFERFLTCFQIPHKIDTFDGSKILRNREEFLQTFQEVRKYQQNNHVTDVVRRVVSARFVDPETVHTTHETRMLCGSFMLQDSYLTYSEARKINGAWKLTFSQYAIPDAPNLNSALTSAEDLTLQSDPK